MAEANVTNEEELSNLIRRLERYGFAERLADDRFRFRTPVWRFLDLCFEVLNDDHDESTKVNSATGDA